MEDVSLGNSRTLTNISARFPSYVDHDSSVGHVDHDSSVGLVYDRCSLRLESMSSAPQGALSYLPYYSHKNVDTVFVTNMPLEMVLRMPSNVTTFLVEDIDDLATISDWLTGENVNHNQQDVTLEYVGPHTSVVPVFDVVNSHITGLHLPLVQNIGELVKSNPHLKSVGVDLDKYHEHIPHNIQTVVWSSSPHRIRHATTSGSVLRHYYHRQ